MNRPCLIKRLAALTVLSAVCGCGSSGGILHQFQSTDVVTGLTHPTSFAFAPDGRLFITEQGGLLKVAREVQPATVAHTLSVQVSTEQGLAGIVLDPNFATNGTIYMYYTVGVGGLFPPPTPQNRVSKFTVSGDTVVPASEVILLQGIASDTGMHNGGCLRFGADGKLYVSTGDGGVPSNGQDLTKLNGKILRINPDGTVPTDNPFVGQANVRPEIYCYGLRNPFRFTIRASDNKLVIGDVGQSAWEEVNVGGAGSNFGWPTYEGASNAAGFTSPAYTYSHASGGASITGGMFLSGSNYPSDYQGRYFFADFIRNRLWYCDLANGDVATNVREFGSSEALPGFATSVVDIEQGAGGDLYVLKYLERRITRVHYGPPAH